MSWFSAITLLPYGAGRTLELKTSYYPSSLKVAPCHNLTAAIMEATDYAEIPEVTILLLGDSEVGKSTFLSRLTLGVNSHDLDEPLPPYSLPLLRDLDQPFIFDIRLFNRPYRFRFFDTASPTNYTLLHPDFVVLCFDIGRQETLESCKERWYKMVEMQFNVDEKAPVMLLGLKRDLRTGWRDGDGDDGGMKEGVVPQLGLRVAQEMRCDRYAECSALTGELCSQVLEDVARTAARTTTEKGGRTEGTTCSVM
ncbi:P-loop containing nucleoside triphosphate hydrolase protein [Patellaria atrata CBS 101060]|uniref:P-loop containing nucleoside triphosphate hydrolase protein n=1 Tax=Patellaria atrata CBS 101060 TaxID=1346257 RepID=A0A9P4VUF3_9PEZI|nr:P-loop containing nucleoside triphosphate hydrolase protein [Patellaria atrata CBS 101060]